jgi:hypothetical protein
VKARLHPKGCVAVSSRDPLPARRRSAPGYKDVWEKLIIVLASANSTIFAEVHNHHAMADVARLRRESCAMNR